MAEKLRERNNKNVNQLQQPRRQRSNPHQHDYDHEKEEEIVEESISLPYRKAYDMAEKFATTSIGQYVIIRVDRLLKIIETTSKWSLPQDQMNDKLQRPLPWIPFLMVIITLRLTRIWLSIGSMFIGNTPVKAQDVVYFVQTRRRKLRSLRLRGIKEICRRETETEMKNKKLGYGQRTFTDQLKRFFSIAFCRPGQHREPERRIMIQRGKEVICFESSSSERQVAKRPRSDDCEADMTLNEILNKYANDNTDDDTDFVPNQAEEDSNDDSSITSSEASESTDATETFVGDAKNTAAEENHEEIDHDLSKDKHSSLYESMESKENGNGEQFDTSNDTLTSQKEANSDLKSGEKAKIQQHENGPRKATENREMDVAFKFVLTPTGIENGSKMPLTSSMEIEKPFKGTPGHGSAAEMKICSITNLEAATVAAYKEASAIHLTSTDPSSDAVDSQTVFTETETEFQTEIHTEPQTEIKNETEIDIESCLRIYNSNTDSSPTLSAASSSTSLDSFNKNEETFLKSNVHANKNENKIENANATSSPPFSNVDAKNDFENATNTSVSSSEDDFHSLIGSPPNFNAFKQQKQQQKQQQQQQTQMNVSSNNISISINESQTLQKTVSEPNIRKNKGPGPVPFRKSQPHQKTLSQSHSKGNSLYSTSANLNKSVTILSSHYNPNDQSNSGNCQFHSSSPNRKKQK